MDHRDSATRQVKAGGRRRPCHRRFPAPLLFLLSLIVLYHTPRAETPELVVTGVFIEESAEVDAAFVADGARDLAFAESSRLVELLAAVPGYRVHGDFLEDPAGEVKSLAQAANRVYVRATVTRADLKRVRYFGDYQVWTFSVGLRLEFFDIRSGQVYYGRTFTYRIPVETAVEIDRAYRYERFAEALAKALEECVTRCGKEYLPARAEAAVLGEAGEGALFLQGGSEAGFYPGLVLIAGDAGADPPEQWMLKLIQVESAFSRARLLAGTVAEAPAPGTRAFAEGVNAGTQGSGPAVMVAGVSPGSGVVLDERFDVDHASLGQWLHDALVDTRAYNMLPPLLSDADPGGGAAGVGAIGMGATGVAAAFFQAQASFSAFGDLKQDEIIGHRAFPEILVRGTVTHAVNHVSRRLGFWAQTLSLGLMLEFYDRRTREVLLTVSHEQRTMEKSNDRYRRADLGAAWRELARAAIGEAAAKASGGLPDSDRRLQLKAVREDGLLEFAGRAAPPSGLRLPLERVESVIRSLEGEELGSWRRIYGMVLLEAGPGGAILGRLLAGDGNTVPAPGDLALLPAGAAADRPSARLRTVEVGGSKVREDYRPNQQMIAGWAHRELAGTGVYNMLPPEILEDQAAAAEAALASGEFEAVDQSEILLQDEPRPQVLVDVRVGLARWEIERQKYRNRLSFTTGVELSFYDAAGEPLERFRDKQGRPTHKVKKAWITRGKQELSEGRVVQGVLEDEFPEQLDRCLEICITELAQELKAER